LKISQATDDKIEENDVKTDFFFLKHATANETDKNEHDIVDNKRNSNQVFETENHYEKETELYYFLFFFLN